MEKKEFYETVDKETLEKALASKDEGLLKFLDSSTETKIKPPTLQEIECGEYSLKNEGEVGRVEAGLEQVIKDYAKLKGGIHSLWTCKYACFKKRLFDSRAYVSAQQFEELWGGRIKTTDSLAKRLLERDGDYTGPFEIKEGTTPIDFLKHYVEMEKERARKNHSHDKGSTLSVNERQLGYEEKLLPLYQDLHKVCQELGYKEGVVSAYEAYEAANDYVNTQKKRKDGETIKYQEYFLWALKGHIEVGNVLTPIYEKLIRMGYTKID